MPHDSLSAAVARHLLVLLTIAWVAGGIVAHADEGPRTTIPQEKDRNRHDEFLKIAKAGGVNLLFMGDSITDGWRGGGSTVWNKYFAPLKAANFGIGGDRTEHVIWRLRNGELEGIQPKLVVLMIGTNNGDSAADVALGIKTIIADIHQRSPVSKILLLGIFPRSEHPDGGRAKNDQVNKIIAGYATWADTRRIVYLDIGAKFLAADQTLPADIMPDFLHPNEKGYQIWADAIIDTVKQLLSDEPGKPVPTFNPPSPVAKIAKVEEAFAGGNIAAGIKILDKLGQDKDAKTADAAKASLATITAWKASVDAEIAKLRQDGDLYMAAELTGEMAASYATGAEAKAYQEQVAELKKDPAFAAGKEFQKLVAMPYEARKDPRFTKMVEAFVKKYPGGYYATQAQGLVIAK